MIFQLVDAEKAHHPVQVLCDALGVSRSGFYAWKRRPPAARAASDEQLAVEIAATHAKSTRRYGSPRIHRALRKRGIRVGRKRVARVSCSVLMTIPRYRSNCVANACSLRGTTITNRRMASNHCVTDSMLVVDGR